MKPSSSQKYSTGETLPIFLIGEPEDLENVRRNIPFPPNVSIFEFQRPLDMKECIKKIKERLSTPISSIEKIMPDCDGTVLAKMLKSEKRTKDIPIIFYTSNNNAEDIIELMQIGIDNYLLKNEPVIKLREYLDDKFKDISGEEDNKGLEYIRV